MQYKTKFLMKLPKGTDSGNFWKKKETWKSGTEQQEDFGKITWMFTEGPCLIHYAKDKDNIVTTETSTTGLGNTLQQKQNGRNTKPIAASIWMKRKRNT